VCLIDLVVYVAEELGLARAIRQLRVDRARFVAEVLPGNRLEVTVTAEGDGPESARLLSELMRPDRGWSGVVVGEGTRCWFGNQFSLIAPRLTAYGVDLWVPELDGKFTWHAAVSSSATGTVVSSVVGRSHGRVGR
jgi:hypothetical protein